MADEDYKLSKFKAAVFAEVDAKTAQIEQEAELYKQHELESCKDCQLEKSYQMIQQKSQEIKKRCKREVAKYSLDGKRDLLLKRNEITARVFDNVKAKLANYVQTAEYKNLLLDKIKEFTNKYKLSNIDIMVNHNDFSFADEIKSTYELPCNVIETNNINYGGFIACDSNNGIYFDETLEQKLNDQKNYFAEHIKLDI